jgi:hypothetical protein
MADDGLALTPLVLSFIRSTQMQQTIDEYFKTLLAADVLPSFPYTALLRRLRVMEVQPRLFRSLAQDEACQALLCAPLLATRTSGGCLTSLSSSAAALLQLRVTCTTLLKSSWLPAS